MKGRSGFWSRVIVSARQITSDATEEPPGLSMSMRMAPTVSSARASRKAWVKRWVLTLMVLRSCPMQSLMTPR